MSSWQTLTAKEVGAGIGLGLLYPLRYLPARTQRSRLPKEARTVVLIHGYLSNRTALFPIQAYLRIHGFGNIISFEYRSNQSAERTARELAAFLRQNVRGGRIDLVCHSLGGLIARVYLQMLRGHRRCDRCITIGSPHQGTFNAYWVPSKIGMELRPESPLLQKLAHTRYASANVRYLSIVGEADNIVLPRRSGYQDETRCIPETGHLGLLWSPKTMKTVLDVLSGD